MCAAPQCWSEHDEWIITLTPGLRGTGRVATTDVRSLKNGVEPMLALIRVAMVPMEAGGEFRKLAQRR